MSADELLKPRYKVIADYPGNIIPIGSIFWDDIESINIITPTGSKSIQSSYPYRHKDKFPHLFKKLEWWEDRKPEEMPEYVKVIREDCVKDTGLYCKVFRWSVYDDKFPIVTGQYGAELEGYTPLYLVRPELNFPGQVYGRLNATHLLPATAAEYEQYINQKEKQ